MIRPPSRACQGEPARYHARVKRFIDEHERLVGALLDEGGGAGATGDLAAIRRLRAYHERQLGYLQAERFAHLFVMLAVALLALGSMLGMLIAPGWTLAAILALLLVLLVPYLFHYYRLENAVQRWYGLSRRLDERLNRVPRA